LFPFHDQSICRVAALTLGRWATRSAEQNEPSTGTYWGSLFRQNRSQQRHFDGAKNNAAGCQLEVGRQKLTSIVHIFLQLKGGHN
jgi:hypothetical protein